MMRAALLVFLLKLPVYPEDIDNPRKAVQLERVSEAIAEIAGTDRRLAALLASTGFVETGYSIRIHEGRCKSWECDHGRARGPWQTWRHELGPKDWAKMRGIENTVIQVQFASARLQLGIAQCGNIKGAIARYMGLPCDSELPIINERMKWYRRAYQALKEDQ